jgi:hypothetical protein
MIVDLEYSYEEALKRQGHSQVDVDSLRNLVSNYSHVPKAITDKQASVMKHSPL